jgi:hypothetical protein
MLFVTISFTVNTLARKLAKVFEDFKTRGQIFRTVKHAEGLVVLAKGEAVLQGVIDSLELEDSLEWK